MGFCDEIDVKERSEEPRIQSGKNNKSKPRVDLSSGSPVSETLQAPNAETSHQPGNARFANNPTSFFFSETIAVSSS